MDSKQLTNLSRAISFVLRHKPQALGLTMDREGWVNTQSLVQAMVPTHPHVEFTPEVLDLIVASDEKGRYVYSADKSHIRATQGHSIADLEINFDKRTPPDRLFHGTATRFIDSIQDKGLIPGMRNYVHLSKDLNTAIEVGNRHGASAVIRVWAKKAHEEGIEFFLSENGVWLAKQIPVKYLDIPIVT